MALVWFSLWQGLIPNLSGLEQNQLIHLGKSLEQQINQSKLELLHVARDNATWDDAYAFMAKPDPALIQNAVTPNTLYPSHIEYMAYFDPAGRLVHGSQIAPDRRLEPSPQALDTLRQFAKTHLTSGMIRVGDQLLLVASAPILPSSGSGPSRGYLLMAKRFDLTHINLPYAETAEVTLSLEAHQPPQISGRKGVGSKNPQIQILNEHTQQFVLLLPGLRGQPLGYVYILQQRKLSQMGQQIVQVGLLIGSVLALVLIAIGHLLMERFEAEQQGRLALERRYREIVQQAAEGMALIDKASLTILEANHSLEQLIGHPEGMVGKSLTDFVTVSAAEVIRLCARALKGEVVQGEFKIKHHSGTSLDIEGSLSRISDGHNPFLLIIIRDIAGRKQAEQTIRENEARLRQITDGMLDVVTLCDLEGRIEYVTPSFEKLLGYTPEEAVGRSVLEFTHPEFYATAAQAFSQGLAGPSQNRRETLEVHKNGHTLWVETVGSMLYQQGQPHKILLGMRDISARKIYQDQIEHQALHDTLTGLGNRRMLEDHANQIFAIAERENWPTSLIFLDVDRFKNINDTLGHHAGDELLVQIARLLGRCIRPEDTLVRYSGDEFAILLTHADTLSARKVAERIISALNNPLELRGHKLQITMSLGIASSPRDGSNLNDLLKAADIAMYQAKRSGQGIALYDPQQNPYSEDHLHLEANLRQAVAAQVFEFHYQPIFDLRSQSICAIESLVRWKQEGQWVSPARFIPVAEELRLIERIDTLGLRRALEWLGANPHSTLEVSLNLSAQTLRDPALPFYVGDLLRQYHIPAQRLMFEITETALLKDLVMAQRVLGELRKLGAKIALDDFGSGYASVSYLRHLPIDRLKLDRTMVQSIGTGAAGEQLLRAMIQLGHTLEMEVLAEGVETSEQMDWLKGNGCDLIQGYLIAKPQPAKSLLELLDRQRVSSPLTT